MAGRDWFPEPTWMSGGDACSIVQLQCEPSDWTSAYARLCQIIADQVDRDKGGLNYVMASMPPTHELLSGFALGTHQWFRALHCVLSVKDADELIDGVGRLVSDLFDWIVFSDDLRMRSRDVLDNALRLDWHEYEINLPEAKQDPIWTFPRAMAWIATRDYLAMARMRVFTRPNAEYEDAVVEGGVWRHATMSLGWLHTATAFAYCKCGAVEEFKLDALKHCICLSVAWEELVHFNGGLSAKTPELVFNLSDGWISMTWPDGADEIRFLRRDILERWPPVPLSTPEEEAASQSTVNCEEECRAWLQNEFAADPELRRSKKDFRIAALDEFAGRLSERGFNLRVWPELARQHGRDNAGAKRKS